MAIKVVEVCHVSPSQGGIQEQLLHLQKFDIVRLRYHLLNFLFFYKLDCSKSNFLNAVVPNLKNSLSLALNHFLPLAGNIVFPLTTSAKPVSRYVIGDSVAVTVAVSDADFTDVAGHHSRDADQFHGFVPSTLQHAVSSDNSVITFSPFAVQLTLFPNHGVCISIMVNHAVCDGGTVLAFLQAWSSINKFKGDSHLLALGHKFSRLYDRTTVAKYAGDVTGAWSYIKAVPSPPTVSLTIPLPTNRVRASFSMTDAQIQQLKTIALNKKPGMARVTSSLVLLSGYVWSCLAKAAEAVGEDVADDEVEYLTCTADIRSRFNPPLPHTYFGNCTVVVLVESTHGTLKGEEGFVSAAYTTGEAIQKVITKKDNVFDDLEHRMKVKGKRVVTIAGSPRFDLYGLDYGWGRPLKNEYPTNDCDGSVYLCKSRDGNGTEIIMSLPSLKMDAFAAYFHHGLKQAAENHQSLYMIQSRL